MLPVPDTVAPAVGAVRLTVGDVVSGAEIRADCRVCSVAVFTCPTADGAVALAASTVTGAAISSTASSTTRPVCTPAPAPATPVSMPGLPPGLRTAAIIAHRIGESTGPVGVESSNPLPSQRNTFDVIVGASTSRVTTARAAGRGSGATYLSGTSWGTQPAPAPGAVPGQTCGAGANTFSALTVLRSGFGAAPPGPASRPAAAVPPNCPAGPPAAPPRCRAGRPPASAVVGTT